MVPLMLDLVIHGVDLAWATGQHQKLDQELCERALAIGKPMMQPQFRTPEAGFGPEVAIADDALPSDRLAACYGREPEFQPQSHRLS